MDIILVCPIITIITWPSSKTSTKRIPASTKHKVNSNFKQDILKKHLSIFLYHILAKLNYFTNPENSDGKLYIEKPFEGSNDTWSKRVLSKDLLQLFVRKCLMKTRKPTDLFILLLTLPNDILPPFLLYIPRNGLGVSSFRTFAPELQKSGTPYIMGLTTKLNNWCKILATNSIKEQTHPWFNS